MKIILSSLLLFSSLSLYAITEVKQFDVQGYMNYVNENPNVKIIAVTPITSSTESSENYNVSSVYTESLLVTIEKED